MRIVIIDDDKLVALSLKTILESTGKVGKYSPLETAVRRR